MPLPPPSEPPAQKSKAEMLVMKINQVTDDTLSSTRRRLGLCEETKEAGIHTLVALDDQSEKLGNVEKGMVQINEDMTQAESALKEMEAMSTKEQCCAF